MTEAYRQPSQFVGTGQGFGTSPQPFIVGHIPPVRLKNQPIQKKMDPPACVQNAMMTKDKKPFTYTPGGIDLSEARSPRLQRRIERNANLGGVGDIPQHPAPHPPISGPLPPSALAAMRPQPQVQVFPSGPPPPAPMRGGAPPPPPPPKQGIPPPPPPPSCPLPTQKVQTSDNQVLERPDMTKIIPDNPMALLRKTGGPQPRRSLVDQIFEESGKSAPEPRTPPVQSQQQFQPPQQRIQSGGTPISPVPQQTYKPSLPQQQQQYQPQAQPQYQPQQYQPQIQQQQQYQPPIQQTTPPREQYSRPSYPEPVKEQPRYQPPVIERQPSAPQNNGQQEVKTSTAHLGSLYIPPINQQQKRIVSPPSPPERNLDSPGIQTPPLREAPRPWQTKKPQDEVPAWAKRENQIPSNVDEARKISPPASQQQQRWPQPQAQGNPQPSFQQQQYEQPKYNQQQFQQAYAGRPDATQHQQPIGIRIDIRTKPQAPYQDQTEMENRPNVVYVTQPLVLQHPGAAPQRQQDPNNQGGARVVPVPVLNRQQSWGSNPVQSNSFKIIQKFTNTDGEEDEYDNVPITEHSPKYTQNFQQPVDQMRRMKLNDGEQSIANTFKQVPRGPQQQQSKGPQVRNIPIQIEGDDTPRPYVHPSEQVVQEPKKYTGSSIPSRSFKILQAMTAPNDYANVEEQNEETPYDEWVYPPHYPPYPYHPYWYDYYRYYYPESYPEETPTKKSTPRSSVSRSTSPARSGRHTPLPYWGYMPPYCPSPNTTDSGKEMSPQKSVPPPWYGYDSNYPSEQDSTDVDESSISQEYAPYYDPYYYHYYYGYPPPMYPPYPPRYANSDTDSTINGYSSLDEKGTKCKKVIENQKKVANDTGVKAIITPTLVVTEVVTKPTKPIEEKIESTTDCETDTETDDEYSGHLQINPLQSMKSITNIISLNTYSSDEDISKEEIQEDEYSGESNDEIDDASSIGYEDDAYPHQLSVIMEESERTESRIRSFSAMSDTTTIAERSDPEEDIVDYSKPELDNSRHESFSDEYKKDIEEENILNCSRLESDDVKEKSTSDDYNKDNEEEIVLDTYKEDDINVEDCEHDDDDDDIKSNDSEDWWGIIGKEDDDLPVPKKTQLFSNVNVEEKSILNEYEASEDIIESDNSDTEDIVSIKVNDVEVDRVDNLEIHKNDTVSNYSIEVTNSNKNTTQNCNEESNEYSSEVTNTNTNTTQGCNEESNNYTEYTVVRRIKKKNNVHKETEVKESLSRPPSIYQSLESLQSEPKSRPRSIYESLEDIQAESTGSLIKVDNFVGILEQIQKETGFWNLNSRLNNEKGTEPVKFRRTRSVEEKNLDVEKRFTWTSFENFNRESLDDLENKIKRMSCGSLEDLKVNIKTGETVEGSTNYIKYNSSLSSTPVIETQIIAEDINDDNKSSTNESHTEESDSSASEKDDKETNNLVRLDDDADVKIPTIKDRIQALRESINLKRRLYSDDTKELSKDKISINDSSNRSKTASSKSSLKSFEEFSEEEEVDSGVTSDMSRHISDTEEFPELRKLTKYQRAATHSRLFKLLQEECNNEDVEDAEENKQSLELNLDDPKNPVNERLVNELVDSLLKLKKGQAFKNLPKEKLYAAAVKILQEDMEVTDTLSGYSTSVQTPQEFGTNSDDYKQYYDTWDRNEESFDIFPSKAFKVLQELSSNKQGGGLSPIIKCPKVLSSKNIHKKLIRLLENSENSSSPIPDKPPLETNDVTRVS